MQGKRVVLGITGGIAAYKSATIASQLSQAGVDVRVIMTKGAREFITPLTLQTLTRNPVSIDTFDEQDAKVVTHIDLADHADLFLIAPATANLLGKLANGIADDMLTTTLLATRAPIVLAPAMNVHMYQNRVVQRNRIRLEKEGVYFIEPDAGPLACGYVGQGRMAQPEAIVAWIENFFSRPKRLSGKKVLITAGPTIEPLDPVRYISNYSSGKMGYALAEAAIEEGAEVTLISGPVSLEPPESAHTVSVKTAQEMFHAVMEHLNSADFIIKTAAVADYRPAEQAKEKIKKRTDEMTISLVKNPDIASEVGKRKRRDQVLVGFAAETENLAEYAQEKCRRKGMDFIIANNIREPGSGFFVDSNRVTLYDATGEIQAFPQMSKRELAKQLIAWLGEQLCSLPR